MNMRRTDLTTIVHARAVDLPVVPDDHGRLEARANPDRSHTVREPLQGQQRGSAMRVSQLPCVVSSDAIGDAVVAQDQDVI